MFKTLITIPPISFLLRQYYLCALYALSWMIKHSSLGMIRNVYVKHMVWTPGVSDIDLIVLFSSESYNADCDFYRVFARQYGRLRMVFPMLCPLDEVTFWDVARIKNHPFRNNYGAHLFLCDDKWRCIYTRDTGDELCHFSIREQAAASPPHVRYLGFNFYKLFTFICSRTLDVRNKMYFQIKKTILKLLQHNYYENTGAYVGLDELQSRLEDVAGDDLDDERRVYAVLGNPIDALKQTILLLDQTCKKYTLRNDACAVKHTAQCAWMSAKVQQYIQGAKKQCGGVTGCVAFQDLLDRRRIGIYHVVPPSISDDDFRAQISYIQEQRAQLKKMNAVAVITTQDLLTSEWYLLWNRSALGAYVLPQQEVYNPDDQLYIRRPPEAWTLWKIRSFMALLEEYELPKLLFARPRRRSPEQWRRGDFTAIFCHTATRQLLLHYYYVRDRKACLSDLEKCAGDSAEMTSIVCARYGSELGIAHWHPNNRYEMYPYLRQLTHRIDAMADAALRDLQTDQTCAVLP